jgi:hypothetical protein
MWIWVYVGTTVDERDEGGTTEGRYVVVWKRVEDTWKLHRDIWSAR